MSWSVEMALVGEVLWNSLDKVITHFSMTTSKSESENVAMTRTDVAVSQNIPAYS